MKKEGRAILWPLYEGWAKERRPLWRREVRGFVRTLVAGSDSVFATEEGDVSEKERTLCAGEGAGEGGKEGSCTVDR